MRLSHKIAYSAVLSAISIIFMVLSHFIPFVSIVLLLIPALCFYMALRKCGLLYGLITIGVSLFVAIAIDGFAPCASFLFAAIVFAPYSLLAYLLKPLRYTVPWQAAVRIIVCAVFFAGVTVAMLFLTEFMVNLAAGHDHGNGIDILEGLELFIGRVGIAIAAVIIVAALLPFDLFFTYLSEKILNRVGIGTHMPPSDNPPPVEPPDSVPPPIDPFEE